MTPSSKNHKEAAGKPYRFIELPGPPESSAVPTHRGDQGVLSFGEAFTAGA
jgi:hypothetical protein